MELPKLPYCHGTGRVADNPKAINIVFSRALTDDELRALDDCLKALQRAEPMNSGDLIAAMFRDGAGS